MKMARRFAHGMRFGLLAVWAACFLLGGCRVLGPRDAPQLAIVQPSDSIVCDELFAGVRARILREMPEETVPSLAVAVARNGEILWEEAFGWADIERRIPATPHTMYSLASVSKPMTATGLMVLVEKGELDLDAPVNRYLFRENQMKVWIGDPEQVTLRRVANHTAGLPRHEHYYKGEQIASKPDMEESIRRYGNVVTPPGERYRYSNFGYGILNHVIARTSGSSFADFMRREVFLPLGMTRSSVGIGPRLEEFAAVRYYDSGNPISYYVTDHAGASEIYASIHDLVRFGMFHIGRRLPDQKAVLSDETRLAMQVPTASMIGARPVAANPPPRSGYGIGWVINDDDLGLRISHQGGMGGVVCTLLLMPGEGIVVAVAANKSCRLPWMIEGDVLEALLPGYAEKSEAHWERLKQMAHGDEAGDDGPAPRLSGDWEGFVRTYAGDFPMTLSFKESGDIHAQLGYQYPVVVTDAEFSDGRLTGSMGGRIRTSDSNRRRWRPGDHLDLDLNLRDDVLNGAVIAIAENRLSYWVELHKKGNDADAGQADPATPSVPNDSP